MQHIDIATLAPDQAAILLRDECEAMARAEIGAGLARGATRRRFLSYIRTHRANISALSDRAYGQIRADIAAMSDAALLAELEA